MIYIREPKTQCILACADCRWYVQPFPEWVNVEDYLIQWPGPVMAEAPEKLYPIDIEQKRGSIFNVRVIRDGRLLCRIFATDGMQIKPNAFLINGHLIDFAWSVALEEVAGEEVAGVFVSLEKLPNASNRNSERYSRMLRILDKEIRKHA